MRRRWDRSLGRERTSWPQAVADDLTSGYLFDSKTSLNLITTLAFSEDQSPTWLVGVMPRYACGRTPIPPKPFHFVHRSLLVKRCPETFRLRHPASTRIYREVVESHLLDDVSKLQEMTIGDGPQPQDGDRVAVHYSLYYKGDQTAQLAVHGGQLASVHAALVWLLFCET